MEGWEGPLSVAYLRLCLIKRVLKRGGANLHVSYQSQGGGGGGGGQDRCKGGQCSPSPPKYAPDYSVKLVIILYLRDARLLLQGG